MENIQIQISFKHALFLLLFVLFYFDIPHYYCSCSTYTSYIIINKWYTNNLTKMPKQFNY